MSLLALEPLIVEHLQARVPGVKAVLSAGDLEAALLANQVTPALHVMAGPWRPADVQAGGAWVQWQVQWMVLVAVRNVSARAAAGQREYANPILRDVLHALQGWQGDAAWEPLQPVASPGPRVVEGVLYAPLMFQTQTVVDATADNSP